MDAAHERLGVAVWDVVFVSGPRQSWWDWLSPGWCRHVLAYGYASQVDGWVIVNPFRNYTSVAVLNERQFGMWAAELSTRDPAILRCHVSEDGGSVGGRVGIFCTSAIKHLLGVPSRALRPVGLYRYLVRHGFKVVMARDVDQGEGPEGRS